MKGYLDLMKGSKPFTKSLATSLAGSTSQLLAPVVMKINDECFLVHSQLGSKVTYLTNVSTGLE